MGNEKVESGELLSSVVDHHIMLRCPHCDQQYEAKIVKNPLLRGISIEPIPIETPIESETEQ